MTKKNSITAVVAAKQLRPLTTCLGKPCVRMTRAESDSAQSEFDRLYALGVADGSVNQHNFGSMMDVLWARTHYGAKYVEIVDSLDSSQSEHQLLT